MSQDNITLNGTIKEITMTEFLLNDARGEFIKTRTKRLAKMYEMFVTKKIKEDKETYKSYIQIFNTLRSNNSKLIIGSNLTKKPIKELEWDKFIEYYNIQYVISLIEVYYKKDSKRDELINKLNLDAFSKAIELNHPIVEIVKFVSNKTNINILSTLSKEKKISEEECGNIFLDIVEEKFNKCESHSPKIYNTDKFIPGSNYNKLISQEGGGANEYKAIKNILEKIAEVKHDFTDAKRAPNLKKTLGTKYNGTLEGKVDKIWEEKQNDHIETINTILKNPSDILAREAANQFTKFLSGIKVLINKCLINFNHTLLSSDHEPKLFNQLFLQKILQNSDESQPTNKGDLIYNRYKFFSYTTNVDRGFNIFSLTADGIAQSKKLVINFASGSDFLENIGAMLQDKTFIYDTSSGMPNTSKLLTDLKLKKLTPICNIWDPASSSISALNENIRENETLKTILIDVEPINNARRNINIGGEHDDHQLFEVFVNLNGDGVSVNESNPIKLCIYPEGKEKESYTDCAPKLENILLKGGFSVNMLDTIYNLVTKNKPLTQELYNKTFENSINNDQLVKLVDYLKKYLSIGLDHEDEAYRQNVISLLIFDLKKTGDWSQINWLNDYKSNFLVSGDKLCALYNIINDNKTLFGTTAQLKKNQISADLGIYINADREPSPEEVDKLSTDLDSRIESFKDEYDISVNPVFNPDGVRRDEDDSFYYTKINIEKEKSSPDLSSKKEYFSTMIEILSNFNKLLNFDIKAYKDDISGINSILINSIVTHFTQLPPDYVTKLTSLETATSIEHGLTEGRRSRRVQARLQKELTDIKAILEDRDSRTPGQDCSPEIEGKINRASSENITKLFNSINSVDNINYIYFSIPTIYSKTLHLISSLKVTAAEPVKYELMSIFTKLFFNLDFNDSHVKECWELGDQKNLQELYGPQDNPRTRGQLIARTEEQLGIHLDNIITDLDSILYLINCILDSNYDTESNTVADMADQINKMQERFNEKIELSYVTEAPDAVEESEAPDAVEESEAPDAVEESEEPEEVGVITQVTGEITEQTDLITEDQTQQPIVGLNVLPRGARQSAPET